MASSKPPAIGSPPSHPSQRGGREDGASLLGFRFRDPGLFRRALVHRSYCNEHNLDATESYERLEFLGDAVLELTVSAHLYRQLPDADEGQLTKARASLVRGATLARVARRWGLGELLVVGRGVEASGGRNQDSVLAAAVEAVIAAVYLDQGLEAAREFITVNMIDEMAAVTLSLSKGGTPPENPKSRLQEYLQGQGRPAPTYRLADRQGPDHNPVFSVEAVSDGEIIGKGQGGKKSDAERAAAAAALTALTTHAEPDKTLPPTPPAAPRRRDDQPPAPAAGEPAPPPRTGRAPRLLRRLGLGKRS